MNSQSVSIVVLVIGLLVPSLAGGQNVVVSTPFHQIGDSFSERNGVNFGFDAGSMQFRQGGFNSALPPFGGFDPNAGARLGFSVGGRGGALSFGFAAGQGSRRSISTTTSTIVVPNGGRGTLIDVIQRPFVTGFVPVLGGGIGGLGIGGLGGGGIGSFGVGFPAPSLSPPVWTYSYTPGQPIPSDAENRRLARIAGQSDQLERHELSSAEQGDISVAEIRRQQHAKDAARAAELSALLAAARAAEESGDLNTALRHYDDLRRQLDKQDRAHVEARIRHLRLRIKQTGR